MTTSQTQVFDGLEVDIVSTGTANIASVKAALQRLGCVPRIVEDPDVLRTSERVVVPGVGTFGAALETLRARDFEDALRQRIDAGASTLGICVGLQILCKSSVESPGVEGLGLLPVDVQRFAPGLRVPQMGWNQIKADPSAKLLPSGFVYFANSYHLPGAVAPALREAGWSLSIADHGGPFVAGLERGQVLACQFHLELSGALGTALLRRWLEASVKC